MKFLAVLLALLTVGCTTSPGGYPARSAGHLPGVHWGLNQKAGESLYLVRNRTDRHRVIVRSIAPYRALTPAEFKDYDIPSEAILAAYSWYAGYGDVIYVLQKPAGLEVYRREMDESETTRLPVRKILAIPS